jgi:peptidoglycan/xylan/chitin deacetylase (PgdA/CDA1 family)
MSRIRRAAGLCLRGVLCAAAVLGGALVAARTTPSASVAIVDAREVSEGIAPAPSTLEDVAPAVAAIAPVATEPATAAPTDIDLDADAEPHTLAPFAEDLGGGLVMTGATHHRLVLFTFDDGPDHRYTESLLDALDRAEVRAVFFLAARRMEGPNRRDRELAEIAREIVRRGHFVGNHTMDHVQLPLVAGAALDEQIVDAEHVFERVLGARPYLVRPPGGGRSPRIDAYLASRGYTEMLWNLGTGDFQVRTPEAVVSTFESVLAREERERDVRGGIVLLHDIHAWSVQAFPQIVQRLEARNCDLLARGEELYDFADDPRLFFAPRTTESASAEVPMVTLSPEVLAARQARARVRTEAHCSALASLDTR